MKCLETLESYTCVLQKDFKAGFSVESKDTD